MTRCELPKRSQILPLPTEAIVNQTDEFPLQPLILQSVCHTRARRRETSRHCLPDSPNIFSTLSKAVGHVTRDGPPALSATRSVNPFGQKPNRNAPFLQSETQSRHDFRTLPRLLRNPSAFPCIGGGLFVMCRYMSRTKLCESPSMIRRHRRSSRDAVRGA